MVDVRLVVGENQQINVPNMNLPTGYQINDTEPHIQAVMRSAGNLTNLAQNAQGGSGPLTTEINGSAGTLSIAANATGIFEDTSHTDSLSAGAKADYNGNSNSNSLVIAVTFSDNSTTSCRLAAAGGGQTLNASSFYTIAGQIDNSNNGTESQAQQAVRKAGSLKNMFINVVTTGTTVVHSRVNSANGVLTVTGSSTGIIEDTSHTDSLSVGQTIDYGTGTGTAVTTNFLGCDYISSNGDSVIMSADASGGNTWSSSNLFDTLGGSCLPGTLGAAEADVQITMRDAYSMSNLSVNVPFTAFSNASSNMAFRINAANGNQQIASITSLGIFTDTTHTDSVTATSKCNYGVNPISTDTLVASAVEVWANLPTGGGPPTQAFVWKPTTIW